MSENIAGAKRYSRPRGFNIAGASAPVAPAVPTPLPCSVTAQPLSRQQSLAATSPLTRLVDVQRGCFC